MSKKIVCDYLEFVNQIKEITEDTLFVIKGDWIPLSEETIKSLNAPQDKVNDYFECNEDGLQNYGLNEVSLVLSGVKEDIQIELDLSEFENFGFDFFSFENISSLKGIILPDTLENLGPKAFYECKNLEYVIIPAGLCERINEFAFDSCPKLAHIKIEKELDVIEDQSVIECKNLQLVEYPKRDANYYYLNPTEFNYEKIRIETERLIMRPLLLKDFEAVKKCYLDPRMLDYEEKEYSSEKNLKEELERAEKCWMLPNLSLCHFAICLKETEEIIGHLPLMNTDAYESEENCEDQTGHSIGWGIAYEYQKQGYATEAAKAVVEWAKSFLKMNRLWAYADKENKASIHVMKKLGMTYETEFKYIDDEGQKRIRVVYAVNSVDSLY